MDKHLPASVRRKLQQEAKAKPCVFEALPLAGDLAPGQRCNVRVRFSPTEEVRGAGVCHRMGRCVPENSVSGHHHLSKEVKQLQGLQEPAAEDLAPGYCTPV